MYTSDVMNDVIVVAALNFLCSSTCLAQESVDVNEGVSVAVDALTSILMTYSILVVFIMLINERRRKKFGGGCSGEEKEEEDEEEVEDKEEVEDEEEGEED
ncbi:hypothetical protein HELRODRAFT_171962 [Helobdella robusta]|uniref:Uncharacterized protein n=1 Tax=Helobdella robusta TaxID=6412 RepID=T1F4W4_HELRO|nr:hypothetical protein HELRODRAFT_171962 [Helobdella robusta]ESO04955.1 hypothetical protein HELRODRAFT_171962 [Helobdella robusta]